MAEPRGDNSCGRSLVLVWARGRRHALAVTVLLVCHAGLLLYSAHANFVTVDEAMHMSAGVHGWQSGEFHLYRVNPPLVRLLATIPVLAAGVEPTPDVDDKPGVRPEMRYARAFAIANRSSYLTLVFLARLTGIVWSLLGGWLIYRWGRELFGARAGLFGLAIWCFEPNVLAHAALLTPDIPATVAGLAATYAFWRYVQAPSLRRGLFAGALLGLALLTKFTMLALLVILPSLWLIRHARDLRTAFRRQARYAVVVFGLALFILNAGYTFHGTGQPIGSIAFVSRTFAGYPGNFVKPSNRFADSWLGYLPSPVPTDYLIGIDVQRRDFEMGLSSYMAGHWQKGGWWYYYLYALVWKVPLAFWGLLILGLALSLRRRDEVSWSDKVFVLFPPLFLFVFISSQTGFSHHLRYVLPVFPFAIIGASRVAAWAEKRGGWISSATIWAVLVWGAASSLRVYPHSLSYFNEAAGGPDRGAEHLVDSNIDWGQDLLYLKRWLDQHPEARPLHLAYFGAVDPHIAGIEFELPPVGTIQTTEMTGTTVESPKAEMLGPQPGTFAISVNFVYGQSFFAFKGNGAPTAVDGSDFQYFRWFQPVAKAGYSIYIYRLTRDQVNAIRPWLGFPLIP